MCCWKFSNKTNEKIAHFVSKKIINKKANMIVDALTIG